MFDSMCCCLFLCNCVWNLEMYNFWIKIVSTQKCVYVFCVCVCVCVFTYDSVFQFLPISSNFAQPLKRSEPTLHRPQSTTWSTSCEGDVLYCVRQMVVTPDTDRFSDPPPPNTVKLHILKWPFIVASLRHTCAIIMLSNQYLDMPHLWGEWIISAKEKCSLTQI